MKLKPCVVSCELAGGIGGDQLPSLDAVVECVVATTCGLPKVTREDRDPPLVLDAAKGRMPIGHFWIGGRAVYQVSSPVFAPPASDVHHHYHRRFPVNDARLLDPAERTVVATTMTWTKSYRLPVRSRLIPRLYWIAFAVPKQLRAVLKNVDYLGKKRAHGRGAVAAGSWRVEVNEAVRGLWWFAPHPDGATVLMRPLPLCDELPPGLIGARRWHGACQPPYWHPDRFTEIVTPC